MSLVTVIKHYDELTTDELYRIIQLRIQGFIVDNGTCYQDLEAHYDKNQYYMMSYDTVKGIEPQLMVGVNALCINKTFVGDDGTEYKYPAFRRQVWEREYKSIGGSTYDWPNAKEFCRKQLGSPNMMCEIMYEGGKQTFIDLGAREVSTNIDVAGRKNWVFVYEE